ncbi:MAG: hypothetical protein QOF84_7286 [Streptomyces sp.]|jgi:hypothetical protein|nr:hypothetical protein [Streptomyces sp.]
MVASGRLPSARATQPYRSPCGAGESLVWANAEVAGPRCLSTGTHRSAPTFTGEVKRC